MDNLIPSQRYRITIKRDQDRSPKTVVMDFISEFEREYLFSGRPEFGTQTIPKRWVKKIENAAKSEPIKVV